MKASFLLRRSEVTQYYNEGWSHLPWLHNIAQYFEVVVIYRAIVLYKLSKLLTTPFLMIGLYITQYYNE